MNKKSLAVNILGWYGVVAILLAYSLVSIQIIQSDTILYQLLNLTGAIGIIVDSIYKKDKQPMVLNIVWATIAVVAIFKIIT